VILVCYLDDTPVILGSILAIICRECSYYSSRSVSHVTTGLKFVHDNVTVQVAVTVFRTITDFFYVVHMVLRFKTAYIRPSTRVFGRGELVTNPREIAIRYFKFDFWIDFVAVLPIPQVCINFSRSCFSFLGM